MRNIIYSLFTLSIIVWCVSCQKGEDFLDKKSTTDLTEETTFSDSARTMDFLVRIYADIRMNADFRWEAGGHMVVSHELEPVRYVGGQNDAVILINGTFSPLTTDLSKNVQILNNWRTPYQNIRRVNVFFAHLGQAPLPAALKVSAKGEARFLRAWYYFQLIKTYGGVPLVGDKVFSPDENFNMKRNTWEECVDYIAKQCDTAYTEVMTLQDQKMDMTNYGRITKGACLGLKSQVLLYAASPLFNGGSFATDAELKAVTSYPDYSAERWKKAADAAKDVMDMHVYSLNEDNVTRPGQGYYKLFLARVNDEFILPGMWNDNRTWEGYFLPASRNSSTQPAAAPTQNLVDCYGMKNGKAITDGTSGYDPANPYNNRDPRFKLSIICNGDMLANTSGVMATVNTTSGQQDGPNNNANTGYHLRKAVVDSSRNNSQKSWPLIRYGEILLNYAEALNEYSGPVQGVYDQLIEIRRRGGVDPGGDGLYGLKSSMTKDEMRDIIQNERRIELAFEGHYLWDARRWKKGSPLGGDTKGVVITGSGASTTYTYRVIRPRIFENRHYLFPVPQSEISKSPDLRQNPLW